MKGYKGMESDMTCRGMQYEIGKTYHVDGKIEVCKNGLHFCENLADVFWYYRYQGNRFFEVDASGIIDVGDNKCAASDLTIIRELPAFEINRAKYGSGYGCSRYGDIFGNGSGNGYVSGDGFGYGYGFINENGRGDGNRFIRKGNGRGNGCLNEYLNGCESGRGWDILNILFFD